jgi:cyanophycinase-like exopeptidase
VNLSGRVALHGGGEFRPGDEPFLRVILEAAAVAACARVAAAAAPPPEARRRHDDDPAAVRVVLLPTAAAGERPEMAIAFGSAALRRVAAEAGIAVGVEAAMVVDASSAAAPQEADRLACADLIYLPGGDPGRLAAILPESPAWRAVLAANARGAVVAGASAGAMILAAWTWTATGGAAGLGLVPGIVVVPHAERVAERGWTGTFARRVPPGLGPLGALGLDERTGIVSEPADGRDWPHVVWRVVGPGLVHWTPSGERTIHGFRDGGTFSLRGPG